MAAPGEEVVLVAGAPVQVQVTLATCHSGCATTQASCKSTVDGHNILIESQGTVHIPPNVSVCLRMCRRVEAKCTLEGLPDGDYEIVYAGERAGLTVPSTQPALCFGPVPALR
jgi:hypothetical protein